MGIVDVQSSDFFVEVLSMQESRRVFEIVAMVEYEIAYLNFFIVNFIITLTVIVNCENQMPIPLPWKMKVQVAKSLVSIRTRCRM